MQLWQVLVAFLDALNASKKLLQFHHDNFSKDLNNASEKSIFINDVLMELSQFKEPIEQELHAQELSEIIKISSTSILESLQKIIKNKKNHNKKKLIQNDSILQNDDNYSLIEEDLIRLCFSDKFQIRNYLFEHVNTKWIKSNLINNIYDKIYIHLHSKNNLNK